MAMSDDAHDLRQAATEGLLAQVRALQAEAVGNRIEIETLTTALRTSRRIGAAIGVIMATLRVTEQEAFALLRQASQMSNRKLRDVAEDVVLTGACPVPPDMGSPARVRSRRGHRLQLPDPSGPDWLSADQPDQPLTG